METKRKIGMVDSQWEQEQRLREYLIAEEYEIQRLQSWEELKDQMFQGKIDLILLAGDLPGQERHQLCRRIREQSAVPLILLTEHNDPLDRILGFEMGADDVVSAPYDIRELAVRIRAVLRRWDPKDKNTEARGQYLEYPGLRISLINYEVIYQGKHLEVPPKELELLYFLASSPNQVFTREQLLDQIWGYEYIGDTRTVDVHIKRLREKMKLTENWKIATVWGIGYKFDTW